jgi:hypothetical protein
MQSGASAALHTANARMRPRRAIPRLRTPISLVDHSVCGWYTRGNVSVAQNLVLATDDESARRQHGWVRPASAPHPSPDALGVALRIALRASTRSV